MDLFAVKAIDYDCETIEGCTTNLEVAEKYVAKYKKAHNLKDVDLTIEKLQFIDEDDLKDVEVRYIYKYIVVAPKLPSLKNNFILHLQEIDYTCDDQIDKMVTDDQFGRLYIYITLSSKDVDFAFNIATGVANQFIKFSKSRKNDDLHSVVKDFNDVVLNKNLYLKRKKAEIDKLQKQIDDIKEEIKNKEV